MTTSGRPHLLLQKLEPLEPWILSIASLALSAYITIAQSAVLSKMEAFAAALALEVPSTTLGRLAFHLLFWIASMFGFSSVGNFGFWAAIAVYAILCSVLGLLRRDGMLGFKVVLPSAAIAYVIAALVTSSLHGASPTGRQDAIFVSFMFPISVAAASLAGAVLSLLVVLLFEVAGALGETFAPNSPELPGTLPTGEPISPTYNTGPGYCPYCHAMYEESTPHVCRACGWDLAIIGSSRACDECGGDVRLSDRYCRRCGTTLTKY